MNLIDDLIRSGYLKTPGIIKAFRRIKRRDFVLPADRGAAAVNAPLPIGYGQTISQPLTVAFMLELLSPQPGEKILDIGSGSGWTVALLAELVGRQGKIYGLEIIPQLRDFAETNVDKYGFIRQGRASIYRGDGYQGLREFEPFDKIIIAAAAPAIPAALPEELRSGGRLVMPVGSRDGTQDIVALSKITAGQFAEKRYPGFIFVPLVREN
ncbi:MAG: protein-L-isoaspartate O-methyltransferase [Planctomycetes bacterium]|jgi:protein-L-isoaspartate(D-aspartate) O-methyltransferase|nr:protein-L-isoaspartate O-methyltransferase [Planctomycetota bacterium]